MGGSGLGSPLRNRRVSEKASAPLVFVAIHSSAELRQSAREGEGEGGEEGGREGGRG